MEKEVIGYDGRYTINEKGEVFSSNYNKKKIRKKLKPQRASQSKKGYYQVRLYGENDRRDSKGRKIGKLNYIHRLVYEHFIGDIPEGKEIDHIDGDTSNNSVSNLQLLSPRANKLKGIKGKDIHWRPYRDEFIKHYEELGTYKKVAAVYDINPNIVFRVIKDILHKKDYNTGKHHTVRYNPTFNDRYTDTNFRFKAGRDSKKRKRDDKGRFM